MIRHVAKISACGGLWRQFALGHGPQRRMCSNANGYGHVKDRWNLNLVVTTMVGFSSAPRISLCFAIMAIVETMKISVRRGAVYGRAHQQMRARGFYPPLWSAAICARMGATQAVQKGREFWESLSLRHARRRGRAVSDAALGTAQSCATTALALVTIVAQRTATMRVAPGSAMRPAWSWTPPAWCSSPSRAMLRSRGLMYSRWTEASLLRTNDPQ